MAYKIKQKKQYISPDANLEIQKVESEMKRLNERMSEMNKLGYKQEARSYERKYWKMSDKENDIKKIGLSTTETTAVKKSLPSFFTIKSDRDIAGRNVKATGYVPKLDKYIVVDYNKGSEYLRNVRGLASEAGKININSFRVISKDVYDKIVKGVQSKGGPARYTSFAGARVINRGNGDEKYINRNKEFNSQVPLTMLFKD